MGEEMGKKYVTIKLPQGIVDAMVDPLVDNQSYASRTEVVKEALRKLAEKYQLMVN
jgi:Arc/MetJ-type ribon-helix-helix transcriptional regulator